MNNERSIADPSGDQPTIQAINPYGGQQFGGGAYPGLGQQSPYAPSQNLPAVQPVEAQIVEAAPAKGGLASMLNFNQIKSFVDRMGGIEGIMGTVSKVQGYMKTFSQMAPMFKILFSSFAGGAKVKAAKASGSKRKKGTASRKSGKKGKKAATSRKRKR